MVYIYFSINIESPRDFGKMDYKIYGYIVGNFLTIRFN